MNVARLILSQKQLNEATPKKKNLTLYTDERYHVSDENGNMFVLLGYDKLKPSRKLLLKITDTMSDRASTEKTFNSLLQELRTEVLPDLTGNWIDLREKEQTTVSTLVNFFCGLYSLVHFAEVSNACLIEKEKATFNNEPPIFNKTF
ncbi:LOW QUALITY PROTEIN: hypothetical protein MAR_014672 [Mya arenaria]|uniref:Uncharacterized protein n=1 Tax=Mya arenaria TaxID=6604 RepID=A0ABY7FET1_MYAAR|nr:LOW QUALITY PROTEIN: hypothetical protein MAR_014672 [Mya arenaria]